MFDNIIFQTSSMEDHDIGPIFSINEDDFDEYQDPDGPTNIPLLALKNTVLFPGVVIPITVGRDRSLKAIQLAYDGDKNIGVLSQRDVDGSTTAFIQGRKRFRLIQLTSQ